MSAYRSNGSPPAADSGRGIKAGSPRGELGRRASVSAVTAGLGTSDKTSGVEQRKEGAAWGKRWEAHLEGMLKQWGGGDGESDPKGGPDQVRASVFGVCVCVYYVYFLCVFIKLHISAQSGPVGPIFLSHSHLKRMFLCVCVRVCVCMSRVWRVTRLRPARMFHPKISTLGTPPKQR